MWVRGCRGRGHVGLVYSMMSNEARRLMQARYKYDRHCVWSWRIVMFVPVCRGEVECWCLDEDDVGEAGHEQQHATLDHMVQPMWVICKLCILFVFL